jgi:PAS domain S-box-containing protein
MRKPSKKNKSSKPEIKDNQKDNQKDDKKDDQFAQLIGLGGASMRKSYYPELQAKIEELKTEREKYKSIFENALNGIFQVDHERKIVDVNPAMARICGFDGPKEMKEEITDIGSQLFARVDDWHLLSDRLKKECQVFNFETEFLKKSSERIWVSMDVRMGAVNDIVNMEGFLQDITLQKEASEELRRLKNYLDNVVNSMPSVLIGIEPNGQITTMNREAEKMAGVASTSAQGKLMTGIFPGFVREMDKIRKAIEKREIQMEHKQQISYKDEERFFDVTVFPLVANGVEGAVIRIDDVTEQVRIEEMMIQSEKMLSVGGLAAGMAHEINNPLAGILQNIQVMKNRLTLTLPKNERVARECGITMASIEEYMSKRGLFEMMEMIMESGVRAAKIVENMLNFSRKSNEPPSPQCIAMLLDRTVELASNDYDLKKNYDFRKIDIQRQYDANLPKVVCEPTLVQQVFLNLLKNAAHAMAMDMDMDSPVPDDNDSEKKANPKILLKIKKGKSFLQVEIADNGPGIAENIRKRIFEPFFTTKKIGVGTGLGLSLSYFIITENIGGTMKVESSPGKGATFIIRFPV